MRALRKVICGRYQTVRKLLQVILLYLIWRGIRAILADVREYHHVSAQAQLTQALTLRRILGALEQHMPGKEAPHDERN